MDKYVAELSKSLKTEVKLVKSESKFRYEILFAKTFKVEKNDFIQTSKDKDKEYYQTDDLRDFITKLEDAEQDLRVELLPFIRSIFKKFYEFRTLFCNTVTCIGELDCLCALA